MTLYGQNNQDDAWYQPENAPIKDLQALGVKVLRGMLEQGAGDYPGTLGSANCISMIGTWAAQLRTGDIQPMIVVTWAGGLPAMPLFGQQMAAQVQGTPGIWWEIGNEIETPNVIGAAADYVAFFGQVVTAMKAADPTCKISPSPVSNINAGGWGDLWTQQCLTAGIGVISYDSHNVHCYAWPANVPPANAAIYFDIPDYETRSAGWGRKAPVSVTESGYPSLTTNSGNSYPEMTNALQEQYVVELLQQLAGYNLPVVCMFCLTDNLPGYPAATPNWGWQTGSGTEAAPIYTPKPVFAAVAALWNTTPPLPPPNPPTITTTSLSSAAPGIAYSQMLVVAGGTAPFTWNLETGALPSGLTLSGAGVITGTPSASAVTEVIGVQVTDANKLTATATLTVTVAENYQVLYQAALTQIKNRDTEMTAWLAANPHATGRAEIQKIIGENAAWLAAHPAS